MMSLTRFVRLDSLLASVWAAEAQLTLADISAVTVFCFYLGDPQEKVQVPRVYRH